MLVFLQPDDSLVTFHVYWQVDTDATDMVLCDPVDKERGFCHELAHPVRVGTLGNGSLKDVVLMDALEELIEVGTIRYQRRLF